MQRPTAYKYQGGNSTIDRLLPNWPDDVLIIVNGRYGRRPIVIQPDQTQEDAIDIYLERYGKQPVPVEVEGE